MSAIRLIHAKSVDVTPKSAILESAGYRVSPGPLTPTVLRALRSRPPSAVVIDLDRQRSLGRDVGLALRSYKTTRSVPIVFAGGSRDDRERVKKLLPDANYSSWERIRATLKRAMARPPARPVRPPSVLAGYSGTPLFKKLGIKSGCVVALIGAPVGFETTLTGLPPEVTFRRRLVGRHDLIVWFVRSATQLERRTRQIAGAVGAGGIWIAWPKKASGVRSDLSESLVRDAGLTNGLVDYKVCAIDSTWSGLKFAVRKTPK